VAGWEVQSVQQDRIVQLGVGDARIGTEREKMETATLLKRITVNPEICHGKPCIRDLRYPVEIILELLSAGMTNDEILADYEDLEYADILASLAFATRLSQVKRMETVLA